MTRKDLFGLLRAAISSAAMFVAGGIIPIVGAVATMLAPIPLMLLRLAARVDDGASPRSSYWLLG